MTQQSEQIASPIENIIADLSIAARRLAARKFESPEDARAEFLDNMYPAMVEICRQMMEVDEIVGDYIENRESYIEPELAGQILGTLKIGSQIVEEVRKATALDDLTKKRLDELCSMYEKATEVTAMNVAAAVGDGDDGPEEDDELPDPSQEGSEGSDDEEEDAR